MHAHILKRALSMAAVIAAAAVLAGCGGGSSSNYNDGTTWDPVNGKTIYRTLENQSDMDVFVELWINDRELVDDNILVRSRSYINVEISGLDLRDYIKYYAEFEDGDRTEGTFSEDGLTVFRNSRSRSGATSENVNGKAAVKQGGEVIKVNARKKQ